MATLHNVTENTKALLKWALIFGGVVLVIFLLIQGFFFARERLFPTPPPAPTVLFGNLPPIAFPENDKQAQHTYDIDTVTGELPTFLDNEGLPRDRMDVFEIIHHELSLLDLQNTRNAVQRAGFLGQGIQIDDTIYRFTRDDGFLKTLDIDIVNRNFSIGSVFQFNDRVLEASFLPTPDLAVERTTELLRSLGAYPADLPPALVRTQTLYLKNGVLFDADRENPADIVRVDYFQRGRNGFQIFYPRGIHSTMHFLVATGPTSRTVDIVTAEFYHQNIADAGSSYPIKSVEQAYQELVDGEGFIAADFTTTDEVNIKEVYLGYYASGTFQEYLMPIYVFKGLEDEFYAYVSAVDESMITTNEESQEE